jgi:hypothetical protein
MVIVYFDAHEWFQSSMLPKNAGWLLPAAFSPSYGDSAVPLKNKYNRNSIRQLRSAVREGPLSADIRLQDYIQMQGFPSLVVGLVLANHFGQQEAAHVTFLLRVNPYTRQYHDCTSKHVEMVRIPAPTRSSPSS